MILQTIPTGEGAATTLARLVGVVVFAGALSASVAVLYRWYVRERVPRGLALLVGLAGVAVVLNTTPLLAAEIDATEETMEIVDALFNIVAFAGSAGAALAAIRVGDHLGRDLSAAGGRGDVDADVSEIVQTVGRVTSVQLPEEIADIVGYDPVAAATKETLAERRFLFPRRLTKAELRERLVSRLKTDYGVGHVDVEFGDDGSISFLAVGSRAAGIGPTLPPATNAVAVRADPAHAASAGDLVQVWETDPARRVVTGELRGVAGDVVTVAIDAADTPKLDPTERYKLVTLPVQDRPDREFASLLRAADETLATVTVEAGSDLDGVALDALDVTVAAITREDGTPEPLPTGSRTLAAGDVLYAIATPELLRKVETAAQGRAGGGSAVDSRARSDDPPVEPIESESTDSDAVPADADRDPAEPETTPSESEAVPEPESAPSESDPSPAEQSDGDGAADEVPGGNAFPDAGDLAGTGEIEAPTLAGDRSDDEATADESDGSAGERDSDADGFDAPADAPDLDGDDGTPDGDGTATDDGFEDDSADDLLGEFDSGEDADEFDFDDDFGDDADDFSFDDAAIDDLPDGDAADGASTDDEPVADAADEAAVDDAAGDDVAGDDAADDAVPFTPLDLGDDDPLSDPLIEGEERDGDDGDGAGDDSERERED